MTADVVDGMTIVIVSQTIISKVSYRINLGKFSNNAA